MDWDAFANSPVRFRISGFNGRTGETVHWGREHIKTFADFQIRARASSTLPVFMPAVEIDGDHWFDGAFGPTGGIPIDSAEQDGFDRFLFVLTRTRRYTKHAGRFGWYLKRTFADYPALVESIITRHVRYNETRERIFELERQGKAYIWAPDSVTISNGNRRPKSLNKAYLQGLQQARKEMPAIREFLGKAP